MCQFDFDAPIPGHCMREKSSLKWLMHMYWYWQNLAWYCNTSICSCSKTCVIRPLSKRPTIGFQVKLSLNAGQKYCRMLQEEHSAIISTFIKLPFVIKIFVLFIFEWLFYTGFTAFITVCQISPFILTITIRNKVLTWVKGHHKLMCDNLNLDLVNIMCNILSTSID